MKSSLDHIITVCIRNEKVSCFPPTKIPLRKNKKLSCLPPTASLFQNKKLFRELIFGRILICTIQRHQGTVRGKNKRPMTKFYKSNLYLIYQKDIWGESNLYRCALDPNILGLKDDLTSRFGVMMEISRVSKSPQKGSTANFVIFEN